MPGAAPRLISSPDGEVISCSACAAFGYPFTVLSSTLNSTSTILSFTSGLASTSVLGSFNTGTLTATSGTSYLQTLSLGSAVSTDTSALVTGAARLCDGDDAPGAGGGVYPFTPTTNYGAGVQSATGTAIWGRAGFYASSTSFFEDTTFTDNVYLAGASTSTPAACTANITSDLPAAINVAGCQTLSMQGNQTTSTGASFCITGGTDGQILIIFADQIGASEVELVDGVAGACAGGTGQATRIAGVWPATTNQNDDVITLIFRGRAIQNGAWFEISRAAN